MIRELPLVILAVAAAASAEARPPVSVVTVETLDIDNCDEFPDNPKPFYWKFDEALLGALHVSGPMRPHSTWTTGATADPTVHLRIAFKRPLPVGTIIGANGWSVSTLRPEAPAPGDVYDDAQWEAVPPVEGQVGLDVLPLPAVRKTRAIRLSKTRRLRPGEQRAESMAGIIIIEQRLFNYTPEAAAYASSEAVSNEQERERNGVHNLIDGGRWVARRRQPITPENPEWIVLAWEQPRTFRYIGLLNAFAKRIEIDTYRGDPAIHPLTAPDNAWQHRGGLNPPVWWRPFYTDCYHDLGEPVTTTAVRLRITEPLTTENPDVAHVTGGGSNYASLEGVMTLADIDNRPIPARPRRKELPPPIAIEYEMPADGRVTIAIDDAAGRRIRNLIADAPRSKGPNVIYWDGLNDAGELVQPGKYTVKTISHEPLSVVWQMTPHNARDLPWWSSPSWGGQHGPGSFLSDHATPSSVCVLGDKVFIGASIAESGHSIAVLDLDGTKVWGTKWLDTAGASQLATDGSRIYVGAEGGWIRNTVMIFELDPETYRHRRLVQFAIDPAKGMTGGLSGLAARDGRIYAAFNQPPRSHLASALSAGDIDPANCLPDTMNQATFGNADSLGALLRCGGTPAPHHWLPVQGEGDIRHMRFAFKRPQPLGTIILPATGARFSALKPDAPFPGDVTDDAQWMPLEEHTFGAVQVVTPPPATATRAIRLTWTRRGRNQGCQGLKILGHRFRNIAATAEMTATSGTVVNGAWKTARRPDGNPISALAPETLTIRWAQPQVVRGLALINPFVKELEVEIESGGEWRPAGTIKPPVWWRPSYHDAYHDFGEDLTVTAIRLRAVKALANENSDVQSATGGKPLYAAIGGIAVLQPIGGDPALPPDLTQRIAVYDAADGSLLRQFAVPQPRGLEFTHTGELLAVSARRIVRVNTETGETRPLITEGIGDPYDLAFDADGNIYVTDRATHQVKVFRPDGRLLRTIGKPGGRKAGPYDPEHMSNPRGLDVDRRGQVWVAEEDYQPKRISWWRTTGEFIGEKMGPARYGGGGQIDPVDTSRFYYGGMEFALDWDNASWTLKNILWRDTGLPAGAPERPIYRDGRRFIVTDPGMIQFGPFAMVGEYRTDRVVPLAMAGPADRWPLLATPEFQRVLGADLLGKGAIWVDANGDAQPQADEVQIGRALNPDYFTSFMGDDLTLNFGGVLIPPDGFNDCGAPRYSFRNVVERPALPVTGTYSTMLLPDGALFSVSSPLALQGPDGTLRWTYPEEYCGVHASHRAPQPKQGEIAGSLMCLGHAKADGDIGHLIGIVTNFGYYALFTEDGLYAARLFHDYRTGAPGWHTSTAERGMEVGAFSLGGEHFCGSFTRAANGTYYVVAGHNHSSISEVHGLETLRRAEYPLAVTAADLAACQTYHRRRTLEAARSAPPKFIRARRLDNFAADGSLDEWTNAYTADIRGAGSARIAFDAENLLLAFEVTDDSPLLNTGEDPKMLFKTGDSVDLQIGTDPAADSARLGPAPGDLRLLLTISRGKPIAVLYRHKVPGTPQNKTHLFSSPMRTVQVDVIQVLRGLPIAAKTRPAGYVLEAAIPLKTLGLVPKNGTRLKADFGILRGDPRGEDTRERLYWANRATAIINDMPSEIDLCPALWGTVEFAE